MITLDDIHPGVAAPLRELRDGLIAEGLEDEANEIITDILVGIEKARAEAQTLEEAERASLVLGTQNVNQGDSNEV